MGGGIMAAWTHEEAKEFNFPNITIYKRSKDGIQTGWRMNANEGYSFYDTTANDVETNPETMEIIPVTYYYKVRYLSLDRDFSQFPFVAIPDSEIPVKEDDNNERLSIDD
jgi:hypothetical protein